MADGHADRLATARTRLVLDRPFLGALTLRLPLVAAEGAWCRTTATDARTLYYNPDYVDALTIEELEFVLAHEALHCALGHFARRQHRVRHRWDVACDLAINPLLAGEGLKPPPAALMIDAFAGMSAEEIYPCLDEQDEQETLDEHLYDDSGDAGGGERERDPDAEPSSQGSAGGEAGQGGGGARPPPPSAAVRERLAEQWRQHMAGAAQTARDAGQLSGTMARLVNHRLQPTLPWRALLAQYLRSCGRDDFSYLRPSRRDGDAILPSLHSAQIDVVAVIDSSGSISDGELRAFLGELDAIKGQASARVTLHACDREMAAAGPWVSEPWETLTLPEDLGGGGGTDLTPPFAWIEREGLRPDLLIYFTDAEGLIPKLAPPYPVLWVVQGSGAVPWGDRIQYG